MIDLNRLEELEKAATPAPWNSSADYIGWKSVDGDLIQMPIPKQECDLIAALRNCAPALIAEVKAARAWLKAYDKSDGFTYIDMNIEVLTELEKACEAYRKLVEQNTREVGDDV